MSIFTVNKNPTVREVRAFGWAMLGGFLLLGAILWIAGWWKAAPPRGFFEWIGSTGHWVILFMWVLGPVLLALSHAPYAVGRGTYVTWMSLAVPIGILMSNVMLTLLYFVLLPVFSLIRFGDPLRKRLSKDGTYWEDHKEHEPTLDRMMRPF